MEASGAPLETLDLFGKLEPPIGLEPMTCRLRIGEAGCRSSILAGQQLTEQLLQAS
jgi:hypothetical protein